MYSAIRFDRGIKILGVTLAVLNGFLWFCTPLVRQAVVEARAAGIPASQRPLDVNGVQELLVYFDPWLARDVFPLVYTVGLAALPFLIRPRVRSPEAGRGPAFPLALTTLLLAFETVWLLLIFVGVFMRGPNWNLFWPWEEWDLRVVPLNNVNVSDIFWLKWMGDAPERMAWPLRELPGLAGLAVYFLAGALAAAAVLCRGAGRATPLWRWGVFLFLVQVAGLVPLKMIARWVWNIKYWIYIPEYFINV